MKILGSVCKIFKGKTGQAIARAAGIAGLGAVAYDAHHIGNCRADWYAKEKDVAATDFYLNNTLYSTNMSRIQAGIKETALNMQLNQGWRRFINLGIGYVKGFSSMLVEHVVPFGLSLGALLAKGKAAKVCAGGLGIYAAFEFIRNFFGLGVHRSVLRR